MSTTFAKSKRYRKQLSLLAFLIAVILIIRFSGISDYITFENLQSNKEILEDFVKKYYIPSVFLFIIIYIISTALSVPGATVLTLAGGFLFGTALAVFCVNIGATTGATLAFLSSRYLIGKWVQNRYSDQLRRFNEELSRNGYLYLLTLRLIPVFPFFLINFFAGLTRIPLRTFVWTTAVGIIPGSFVYTFAGSQLNTIKSVDDIFSRKVLAAFLLLALFTLFPAIFNKIKPKRKEDHGT